MMSNRIRCVAFDLTATLFDFAQPVGRTYVQIAVQSGLSSFHDEVVMQKAFKTAFKSIWQRFPCYAPEERQWWRLVVKQTLDDYCALQSQPMPLSLQHHSCMFDEYFQSVYQYYGSQNAYRVYQDAVPVLNELRKRENLVLGVLTNSPLRTIDNTLPMLSLHHFFDFTLSCVEIGQAKPHKKCFEEVLKRARRRSEITPDQVLYVGNDPHLDESSARSFGMQSYLVDRERGRGLEEVLKLV